MMSCSAEALSSIDHSLVTALSLGRSCVLFQEASRTEESQKEAAKSSSSHESPSTFRNGSDSEPVPEAGNGISGNKAPGIFFPIKRYCESATSLPLLNIPHYCAGPIVCQEPVVVHYDMHSLLNVVDEIAAYRTLVAVSQRRQCSATVLVAGIFYVLRFFTHSSDSRKTRPSAFLFSDISNLLCKSSMS